MRIINVDFRKIQPYGSDATDMRTFDGGRYASDAA
jgi:hypothetical protein